MAKYYVKTKAIEIGRRFEADEIRVRWDDEKMFCIYSKDTHGLLFGCPISQLEYIELEE